MTVMVHLRRAFGYALAASVLTLAAGTLGARQEEPQPQFQYAGGTEDLRPGCEGNLELSSTELTFRCRSRAISIPLASIVFMEYRPDVSRKVRRLKPKWKVRPAIVAPIFGGKRNRYFTVVCRGNESDRVLVLAVKPEVMRPYLAEIDLKSGKRVDVQGYEKY